MNKDLNAIVMPTGTLRLEWSDTEESVTKSARLLQEEIYKRFVSDPDSWLLFLGFCDDKVDLSPSLAYWRDFANLFTRKLSQTPDLEILRHKAEIAFTEDELLHVLSNAPMMTGAEYLSSELLNNNWLAFNRSFSKEIKAYSGSVEEFIRRYSPDVHLVGRVFFHLVENRKSDLPFAFLATYSTRLNKLGQSRHLPLKHALQEYGNDSNRLLELLATVHVAAGRSVLISGLLDSGELFHPLSWSAGEAYLFLKEIPIYEESGILCRIPNWWKGNAANIRLNFNFGDAQPSFVGLDAILSFDAQLLLGNTKISVKEARKLLEESEGLAFIKNKWVAVDPEKLKATLDAYERVKGMINQSGFSMRDALRMELEPERILGGEDGEVDLTVSRGKWLGSVVERICNPERTPEAKPGDGFRARLRGYQQKGLNWLCFLHSLRFGACLADDMGLGKTVQVLAFLSAIKTKESKNASLLVIPASLISNWVDEIEKFYPNLIFFVAHPAMHTGSVFLTQKELDALDLVITTYSLTQRYEWLHSYSWTYVILDEAQAIKNPGTKQTGAVKRFQALNRIIMTGTPIENRLGDLWSLFDFLNPGLLGNKSEFGKFIKGLKDNPGGYSRLRKVVMPYILRRLKTDKSVISDLPEKVEMKTYAALSKKQVVLYQNLIEEVAETIARSEKIQRKGLILSSLMKLKQLCNHPDQYLGTGEYEEKDSGKFARLREIGEIIYEKRERALVFTQFREITAPLCSYLESIFKRKGLILHGGVPVGKRKKIIEQFQSEEYVPFMVLSLKAGGVGLNLTRANHVIHFDRWWNPAVENQATDRAFRIGQKKNVVVHKFITKGTIEEKIDGMLEEKSRLFQDVVAGTGEGWITEMNDDELKKLFTLTL
jgi:non-specific serine/threonine protein kinase